MLRNLGRLIWRQPREISVMNYANHMVYEVYTNNGFLYFVQEKETQKVECIDRTRFDGSFKKENLNRDEDVQSVWGDQGRQTVLPIERLQ